MPPWQTTREKKRRGRDKHSHHIAHKGHAPQQSFALKSVSSAFPKRKRRISEASMPGMNYYKKPLPTLSD